MTEHVQIQGIPPRIQYVANGLNQTFEFPFAVFKHQDLKVYLNENLLSDNTYSVTGTGQTNGGSVTFNTAPPNKTIVTLVRDLKIERTTDFQEGGALRAKTLNDELDYQIACQQQIADSLNRSMVLPPYALNTNVDLTLPLPQAGKAIVWNKDGTNLENSIVEVNTLENTLKEYKQTAESASANATVQSEQATQAAETATEQASIATQKAEEVSTTLTAKANIDMDNLTERGIQTIKDLSLPKDISSAIDYTSNTQITIPSDGWLMVRGSTRSLNLMDSSFTTQLCEEYIISSNYTTSWCPVKQGMCFRNKATSQYQKVLFFPIIGV